MVYPTKINNAMYKHHLDMAKFRKNFYLAVSTLSEHIEYTEMVLLMKSEHVTSFCLSHVLHMSLPAFRQWHRTFPYNLHHF